MTGPLVCWKCGASLAAQPLPLVRAAECEACHADLHVCRLCEYHDPRVSRGCREPIADDVPDKERANFCGYFRPRAGAHRPRDEAEARKARDQLDALFGDGTRADPGSPSDADAARGEWERLFGLGDKDRGG